MSLSSTALLLIHIVGALSFQASNIIHQIHSNNDLREFDANLLKGTYSLKFDPYYLEAKECPISQRTVNGCFLLNHDRPDPVLNSNYNSTDDLITYFKSDRFQLLRQNHTVTVALCFKSAPELCNLDSQLFQSWLALVDDFYLKVINSVEGVEIVLDGDGKPLNCLIGRWTPWNAVWISSDTSVAGALTSNSQENDFYRFLILNDPESIPTWTNYTDNNYYKFSNLTYPYQLWEPDSQATMLQYANLYKYGTVAPAGDAVPVPEHPPGYAFAINIDVSMQQVYTGSVSGVAVNKAITTGTPLTATPFIVYLSPGAFLYSQTTLTNGSLTLQYAFLSAAGPDPLLSVVSSDIGPLSELPQPAAANQVAAVTRVSASQVALLFEDASTLALTYDIAGQKLSTDDAIPTPPPGSVPAGAIATDLAIADASALRLLVTVEGGVDGAPQSVVVLRSVSAAGQEVASATIFVAPAGVAVSDAKLVVVPPPQGADDGSALYLIASVAVGTQVLGCYFSLNTTTLAVRAMPRDTDVSTAGSDSPLAWVVLTVGSQLALSAVEDVVMLVNADGFCYNSKSHNTQNAPSVCSQAPSSTAGVLDYSIGLARSWTDLLSTSSCLYAASTGLDVGGAHGAAAAGGGACVAITACSTAILHGSFDQGSAPSVALGYSGPGALAAGDEASVLLFLETHRGIPSGAAVANTCGEPVHVDGTLIDGFPVQAWLDNLRAFT